MISAVRPQSVSDSRYRETSAQARSGLAQPGRRTGFSRPSTPLGTGKASGRMDRAVARTSCGTSASHLHCVDRPGRGESDHTYTHIARRSKGGSIMIPCRALTSAVALMIVFSSARASAQEASIIGSVSDETKAVLPGATVTAVSLETGVPTAAVSDERGQYRLLRLLAGRYKMQAELQGFASIIVPEVELLVGQNASVPFVLKLAQVTETVTITGETPLVDISSSQVAGNVDRRQMEELPLQGRNWMELSKLVKGITANDVTNTPGVGRDDDFQLNLDGQQITQKIAGSGFGQPRFSRESIAEFQIVTNMFDITQGRSTGIEVQAITRSGANTPSGSVYGFFRDAKLNAPDPVANRVLPYSNQQVGGALGGPIVKDKAHFFASYEYEREPGTYFSSPSTLPGQSFTVPYKNNQKSFLVRFDVQLSAKDRVTIRGSRWDWSNPVVMAAG